MSELELKCGNRVEIKSGRFKGAVGIIRKIVTLTKTNVQVDFIGGKKTIPLEHIQGTDMSVTALAAEAVKLITTEE